jgi:hypothetical protein
LARRSAALFTSVWPAYLDTVGGSGGQTTHMHAQVKYAPSCGAEETEYEVRLSTHIYFSNRTRLYRLVTVASISHFLSHLFVECNRD